ncbi:MAG: AraC family transcriptional regulator [Spirochaetaceae bacterium]|nr:AraC family transcriptional regulator [Spirochaetaceae bacterium]
MIPNADACREEYRARLARALDYVRLNLAAEVRLEEAAAAACFSKYHFHRLFTALVGESFADHVRRLRLERAANFLEKRPGMSVTEVAMASGFSSSSVFSRDFAARFGAPPSRWREERRAAERGLRAGWPGAPGRPAAGGGDADTVPASATDGASARILARFSGQATGDGNSVIRRLPAFRFAAVLHHGGYGAGIDEAWTRLYRWAGPRGLLGPGIRAAGVSWDDPAITPAERCRYSACLEVPAEVEPAGPATLLEFPARSYLVRDFRGPEAGLAAAYTELYRRDLPECGFVPVDAPAIEIYRRSLGPDQVFDLEIAVPVEAID